MSNLFRNTSPGALTREQAVALEKKRGLERQRGMRQARALAAQGRGDDTEVAHVAPGEIVLPKVLQTPEVMAALAKVAAARGVPLARLRVGDARNRINPKTGAPEFDMSDRDLLSIRNAVGNAGNSMWSGDPWSSVTSNFDRFTSMPINIGSSGAGLSEGGAGSGGSAPYRYGGPEIEEITVVEPPGGKEPRIRLSPLPYPPGDPRNEEEIGAILDHLREFPMQSAPAIIAGAERIRRQMEQWIRKQRPEKPPGPTAGPRRG